MKFCEYEALFVPQKERNNEMVERLPGDEFESYSIDYCMEEEDNARFDTDTLNQTNSSGLPPHYLSLKRNACIILLRSLNPKRDSAMAQDAF